MRRDRCRCCCVEAAVAPAKAHALAGEEPAGEQQRILAVLAQGGYAHGHAVQWVEQVAAEPPLRGELLKRLYTLRSPPCLVGPRIDDSFSSPSGAPPEDYVLAVGNDAARDFGMLAEAVAPLDLSLRLLTRRPVDIPPEARCRVKRITRHVSFTELRDLYDQARFVLLPLKERMSPGGMTSLLEAMAMGKAVVMTFSSGVVEFVEDGVTGIVVPLGDAAAFRAAVERLWGDPALAEAMGRAARRRFEAECSTARFAQRLAAVLAE